LFQPEHWNLRTLQEVLDGPRYAPERLIALASLIFFNQHQAWARLMGILVAGPAALQMLRRLQNNHVVGLDDSGHIDGEHIDNGQAEQHVQQQPEPDEVCTFQPPASYNLSSAHACFLRQSGTAIWNSNLETALTATPERMLSHVV
jgi:hypothetical protein